MKKISALLYITVAVAGVSIPARAQTDAPSPATPAPASAAALNPNKNQPIDITADQTLEWHRNDLQYIGRGHVIAKQGPATIKADTLTADYRQTDTSKNDIYRLTAVGNVTVSQDDDNAVGDHAVYTTDDGVAIMTGKHLVMTTPDQVVTARDNFRYEVNTGRLTANGQARAIRTMDDGTKDIIDADQLSAWFVQQEANGPRKLDHMTAVGHVVITTPTDILHGDNGDYVAGSQIATVTGHVRIDRGPNILVGEKADINLATNVSRMVTMPGVGGGRVHGIFYPNSDKGGPAMAGKPGAAMKNAPTPERTVTPPVAAVTPPAPAVVTAPTPENAAPATDAAAAEAKAPVVSTAPQPAIKTPNAAKPDDQAAPPSDRNMAPPDDDKPAP